MIGAGAGAAGFTAAEVLAYVDNQVIPFEIQLWKKAFTCEVAAGDACVVGVSFMSMETGLVDGRGGGVAFGPCESFGFFWSNWLDREKGLKISTFKPRMVVVESLVQDRLFQSCSFVPLLQFFA